MNVSPAIPKAGLVEYFWNQRQIFLGHLRKLGGRFDDHPDIFQEACLRFLASKAQFFCLSTAAKYMFRILHSLVVDRAKQQRRLVCMDTLPERICEPESPWGYEFQALRVRGLIDQLSHREKLLIHSYVSCDLSGLKEKSHFVGLPPTTYRYQVRRTIAKLRKCLQAQDRSIPRLSRSSTKFHWRG